MAWRRSRSAFAVSGRALRVFSSTAAVGCDPDGTPRCGLLCSSKPCFRSSTAPGSAIPSAPLLEFLAPTAHCRTWAPVSPGRKPLLPAPSAHRVSHPLDGLLHPVPGGPSFRSRSPCLSTRCLEYGPSSARGVPTDLHRSAQAFRPGRASGARVSSSRRSPPPRWTRFRVSSSLALRREPRLAWPSPAKRREEPTGASESRSRKNRCSPWELPAGTGLPEVLGRLSGS